MVWVIYAHTQMYKCMHACVYTCAIDEYVTGCLSMCAIRSRSLMLTPTHGDLLRILCRARLVSKDRYKERAKYALYLHYVGRGEKGGCFIHAPCYTLQNTYPITNFNKTYQHRQSDIVISYQLRSTVHYHAHMRMQPSVICAPSSPFIHAHTLSELTWSRNAEIPKPRMRNLVRGQLALVHA